jgi:hypothetical protein
MNHPEGCRLITMLVPDAFPLLLLPLPRHRNRWPAVRLTPAAPAADVNVAVVAAVVPASAAAAWPQVLNDVAWVEAFLTENNRRLKHSYTVLTGGGSSSPQPTCCMWGDLVGGGGGQGLGSHGQRETGCLLAPGRGV